MWTISIAFEAMQDLRSFPRGPAGDVTDIIDQLRLDPHPPNSDPVEDTENIYVLNVAGYTVEYEVITEQRLVKILSVG